MEIKYFRINNIITLIKCNEIHLVIISYIIAKNINQTTRKPFHVSNVKKLFDGNKINGNKLSKMTCNEFIDTAKQHKIPHKKAETLFNQIHRHFNRDHLEQKTQDVVIELKLKLDWNKIPHKKAETLFNQIHRHFNRDHLEQKTQDVVIELKLKLDWNRICEILLQNKFPITEDNKHKLETLFTKYSRQDKVDFEYFKNDLCRAYYNDDDDKYMFYKILTTHFRFPL
eukprot:166805_1